MKFEAKRGNLKIGTDTLIINMGSATHCASGLSGQCSLFNSKDCYAFKAEIQYKDTLPYRVRQESTWLSNDAFFFVEHIQKELSKKTKVNLKYVRWNEAGDLHSADCLQKLCDIAQMTPEVTHYTYTHNKAVLEAFLDGRNALDVIPRNLVINCSDFYVDGLNTFKCDTTYKVHSLKNNWPKYRAYAREKYAHNRTCIGDCSKCTLCKVTHGREILVPLH